VGHAAICLIHLSTRPFLAEIAEIRAKMAAAEQGDKIKKASKAFKNH
jgi:hypothetical protein